MCWLEGMALKPTSPNPWSSARMMRMLGGEEEEEVEEEAGVERERTAKSRSRWWGRGGPIIVNLVVVMGGEGK
jgi:hypothetical protein